MKDDSESTHSRKGTLSSIISKMSRASGTSRRSQSKAFSPRHDEKEDWMKSHDRKSLSSKTAETMMTSSNGSGMNNQRVNFDNNDALGFPTETSIQEEPPETDDFDMFPDDEIINDLIRRRSKSAAPLDRRVTDRIKSEPRIGRKSRGKSAAPERDYYSHMQSSTPSSTRRGFVPNTDPRNIRKTSSYRDRQSRYGMDDHHDNDFLYSERNQQERHFSDYLRSRRTSSESMYRINSENDELKEENYKMSKQIETLKQKLSDLKFTSSIMSNSDDPEQNMNDRVSKVLSTLHRRNDKLEKDNTKMRDVIRSLRRTIDRQEETIGFYRMKDQDAELDYKAKDDIITLLEREKDEMRHFLLESQIENKVVNKKCDILRNKVTDLEQALMAKSGNNDKPKAPDKIVVLDSKSGDRDADTISSLGD